MTKKFLCRSKGVSYHVGDIITAYQKGYHRVTGMDGHCLTYETVIMIY